MSSCFHIFSSQVSFGQTGDVPLLHLSEREGFFCFKVWHLNKYLFFLFFLLFCCFASYFLKWRQMLSCYGQRAMAFGFFRGMDDTLSVNRKEFPGGGRCTDQQKNPHIDFPASAIICMHCRQCILFLWPINSLVKFRWRDWV